MKTILDLCGGTGSWSKPYREAGYNVVVIDVLDGCDVRLLQLMDEPVHGILAAPPPVRTSVAAVLGGGKTKEMRHCLKVFQSLMPV